MPAQGRFLRIATLILFVAFMGAQVLRDPATSAQPVLTAERLTHITTGDHTGGGHLHGVNKPCKSEFPPSWTTERIAQDIPRLAANDNIAWRQGGNGYKAGETLVEGLKIRIVVDPADNEIITAYPVNVPRNPCPAANDNQP